MEITVRSTEETKKLAQQIANSTKPGDILALYGDLGSGKTTFTRYFVEALGLNSRVQSPTFIIHRVYKNENIKVNHIDLYRLHSLGEVLGMGFQEMLSENDITIIEWPKIAEDLLDKLGNRVKRVYFEYIDENERLIKVDE